MAEINYTVSRDANTQVVTWSDVTDADTFQRFRCDGTYEEISVHVFGTLGGATVAINGANYDADGVAMTKIGGGAAEASAESLFSLVERPGFITPTHAGGASESTTVVMRLLK